MPVEFELVDTPALTNQGNMPRPGYVSLFDLHNGDIPTPISESDSQYPLAVAANVIFDPQEPISVNDVSFQTVHYSPKRHPGSNKPYRTEMMIPPIFGVSVSETVLNHPESEKAHQLIENLQTIRSPWVGIESISSDILEKSGIQGLPPVIVAIASETDFNKTINEGFSYGRWVSVVEPGTRLGVVNTGKDLVFQIVWGSNVWQNGYSTSDSSHTFFTIQHEISHLLTLVALRGRSEGVHPENQTSIAQVLGTPIWEGLADCISGRLRFIGNDELYTNMNIGYKPKKSFYEQQQTRSLGNTTNYMNELFTNLLLRAWQNNGNIEGIESIPPFKATDAIIEALSGRRNEVPENAENGWLVKQIFSESDFDWQRILKDLKSPTQNQAESVLTPLLPHKLQSDLKNKLVQKYVEAIPNWDPFGEDSIK